VVHNLELAGIATAPNHFLGDYPAFKFRGFADALPADLRGCTVLDIGCNAGFYTFEMKRRGADRVVGIDSDPLSRPGGRGDGAFGRTAADVGL
jgi:tRNA (mo5U34)-methyltransferase